MRTILVCLLLVTGLCLTAQWDNNAGLIPSLLTNASIKVSSGANLSALSDGHTETMWESNNPLPTEYLDKQDLNLMLHKENFLVIPTHVSPVLAFDGNTDSKVVITEKEIAVDFKNPVSSGWVHIKINTAQTVKILFVYTDQTIEETYLPTENYQIKSFQIENAAPLKKIVLVSEAPYDLFELGILHKNPVEFVEFDLKKPTQIGWISTKHFNGEGVTDIRLLWSLNGKDWILIQHADPMATTFIPILIQPAIEARYLKVEFTLAQRPYQKAKLFEMAAYDENGPYGPRPEARPSRQTYNESMGINGFWGWGYSVYSDLLNENQGPFLFSEMADRARNYHRIDWDIDTPQDKTDFNAKKQGDNHSGANWMQWEREYFQWEKAGFNIDASITFEKTTFSDKVWINTENEAFNYGKSFAGFFIHTHRLISSVEIGNEPWEYSRSVYQKVLSGMASGIKSIAPETIVLPCAVQAFDPINVLNNYISGFVTEEISRKIDGLNTHIYPYIFTPEGKHKAINPEDPRSELWSLNNLTRFRDANMSGKAIYVTEYGYDSRGGGEDCTHDVCVSEFEQAVFGTRMTLILYRLGVDAFYWYFFANVDYHSMMHNRSGLTASYSGGFAKKAAFNAFVKLKQHIGDLYFKEVVMENDQAWVYAYADAAGKIKKLIAWRPVPDEKNEIVWVDIPTKLNIGQAEFLVDFESTAGKTPAYSKQMQKIRIGLSGNPVILSVY